ncbi:MAG TPA: phytanoyl-CoA dioxygenase family protein [Bdellovibrionota bacterium]|nr:phytanoyl-CoA dioxygenase family protein [Bdellovibrionota bacterium]
MAKTERQDWAKFKKEFDERGYSILPGVFDAGFVARCRTELEEAIRKETAYHKSAEHRDRGMVLMCPLYGDSFLEVFDNDDFSRAFETVMGEGCIIYSYTSSSMPPKGTNYSHRIHVDCPRLIPDYITNMGAILLLDDFTKANGATWVLPASQWQAEPPSEEAFRAKAVQLEGRAGDVIYLNSRLWHSGGLNTTEHWRHSTTIGVCRPWMKQRLDFPRLLGDLEPILSERALQKFGFHAQVPASYAEYFAPPERRKYKQKAE